MAADLGDETGAGAVEGVEAPGAAAGEEGGIERDLGVEAVQEVGMLEDGVFAGEGGGEEGGGALEDDPEKAGLGELDPGDIGEGGGSAAGEGVGSAGGCCEPFEACAGFFGCDGAAVEGWGIVPAGAGVEVEEEGLGVGLFEGGGEVGSEDGGGWVGPLEEAGVNASEDLDGGRGAGSEDVERVGLEGAGGCDGDGAAAWEGCRGGGGGWEGGGVGWRGGGWRGSGAGGEEGSAGGGGGGGDDARAEEEPAPCNAGHQGVTWCGCSGSRRAASGLEQHSMTRWRAGVSGWKVTWAMPNRSRMRVARSVRTCSVQLASLSSTCAARAGKEGAMLQT